MIILALTIVLSFFVVTVIQLCWWIPKNGFSFCGNCVNHFGEPYSCNVIDWIARGILSPFAWPAVFVIILICFAISRKITKAIKSRKIKAQFAHPEK